MSRSMRLIDNPIMVSMTTATLTGFPLRFAVAMAEGLAEEITWSPSQMTPTRMCMWTDNHGSYDPDQNWDIAGPLIEQHAIGFVGHDADNWLAFASPAEQSHQGIGPTHLVAACRLVVRAALGEVVSVPAELVQAVQA